MDYDISNTANVLIIGDSFVSRLESVINNEFQRSTARHVMALNQYATDALKAPREINCIYFYGVPGAGVMNSKPLHLPHELLFYTRPKYAILEIGGNDADSPAPVAEIARAKVHMAKELISNYDVRAVSMSTILPRDVVRHTSPESYLARAKNINLEVSALTSSEPALTFHRHKGFWRDQNLNPTTTQAWSADGVHANTPEGMQKYRKSIIKCLHNMIKTHHTSMH